MSQNSARFDIAKVKKLAGGKTFERGEEYFEEGSVEIQSLTPQRVVAEVAGSEDYRTILTGWGSEIGGNCSCPAFAEQVFCKHMVATALAANAGGRDIEVATTEARSRIRQYLKSKTADELVDLIFGVAEQYPELLGRLEIQSAALQADDGTLEKRLRKAIDAATRTRGYVDYREAPRWQAGVEEVLEMVAQLASGSRAGLALGLIDHAIEAIEAKFEAIDDSDGLLGELLSQALDIHHAAAEAARPEPIELARSLFARETKSDFETFRGAAERYADVLGESGLAEYRRLAVAAWDKLPARSGMTRGTESASGSIYILRGILDFFAKREGDVDARIAVYAKNLESPWDYLELAQICASEGRENEALRRAEEGLWLFEDRQSDERLLFFAVNLLTKARRKPDAEAHLWRAFEKQPSLEIFKQLRKLAGTAAVERAVAVLEARLGKKSGTLWHDRPDLLVEIYISEKRFDDAWSSVSRFGASPYARQALVEASDMKFPREALQFYEAQIERLLTGAGYEEAVKIIRRMARLRSEAEQLAYVADLRVRHGRKRNFMKLLG
ncbi:SWIM zinc finger domain-containing protein [Bradyrhizobium sp. GCM10027634]|uniref:SWIM zinc finger family protein n=1 Tax=unclassified Bradyrhizobium TaxID=2631580 RepID=UPI00188AA54E|nr:MULTISPECIES: DUF6880 family protein [unclassified Bradyrhizobium]MDN5001671.1 SWIM zinc finger family protein [Bradyrhizobium sp. WYCCWR 12677]QOZ46001.1 acyltransferase [Bradyrhizobium sp. CCBAU 53340]